MEVDECNPELKIVVEYNGDFWHCNPRFWLPDQYNSGIRMTAKEKWRKDRARWFKLKNLGYEIIIIWESDWIENAKKYIDRIENLVKIKENKNV